MGKDIETVHIVLAYIQAKQSRANVSTLMHQPIPNMDKDTLAAAVEAVNRASPAWVEAVKAGASGGPPAVAPPLKNCALSLTDYLSKAEFVRRALAVPTSVLKGALNTYTTKDKNDVAVEPTRRVLRSTWASRYPVLPVLSTVTLPQLYDRYISRLPPIALNGGLALRPLQRVARIDWMTEEEEAMVNAAKTNRQFGMSQRQPALHPREHGRASWRHARGQRAGSSSTFMSQTCVFKAEKR